MGVHRRLNRKEKEYRDRTHANYFPPQTAKRDESDEAQKALLLLQGPPAEEERESMALSDDKVGALSSSELNASVMVGFNFGGRLTVKIVAIGFFTIRSKPTMIKQRLCIFFLISAPKARVNVPKYVCGPVEKSLLNSI